MLKMVLGDYKTLLNFRSFQKQIAKGTGFFYLYILMFAPTIIEVNSGLFYYAFFLPAIFGMAFSVACPNRLPKLLYLCPMDQEERKQYLRVGYRTRCIVPMMLYVIIASIVWMFGKISGFDFVVGLFHLFLLCLVSNLYGGKGKLKTIDYASRKRQVVAMQEGQAWGQISLICSFFFYYAIYEGVWKNGSVATALLVLYGIWFTISVGFSIYYVMKHYRRIMQESLYYENVMAFEKVTQQEKG